MPSATSHPPEKASYISEDITKALRWPFPAESSRQGDSFIESALARSTPSAVPHHNIGDVVPNPTSLVPSSRLHPTPADHNRRTKHSAHLPRSRKHAFDLSHATQNTDTHHHYPPTRYDTAEELPSPIFYSSSPTQPMASLPHAYPAAGFSKYLPNPKASGQNASKDQTHHPQMKLENDWCLTEGYDNTQWASFRRGTSHFNSLKALQADRRLHRYHRSPPPPSMPYYETTYMRCYGYPEPKSVQEISGIKESALKVATDSLPLSTNKQPPQFSSRTVSSMAAARHPATSHHKRSISKPKKRLNYSFPYYVDYPTPFYDYSTSHQPNHASSFYDYKHSGFRERAH